jgi:hypothetical protein
VKRFIISTVIWFGIVVKALRWLPRINLGNHVWYRGTKYIVVNGVIPGMWRLAHFDNGDNGWVPREDCRLVITFPNLWHSVRSGYRFFMGYWFRIWVNQRLRPQKAG